MNCTFVVGQQVVCISGDWRFVADLYDQNPVKGEVYTVAELHAGPSLNDVVCPSGVWLKVVGKPYTHYCSSKFRPARTNENLNELEWALKNPNAPIESPFYPHIPERVV